MWQRVAGCKILLAQWVGGLEEGRQGAVATMRLCNQFSSWAPLARGAWRASCHVRVSGRSGRGETAELLERPYPPSLPSESLQRRRGTAPPSLRSATDTHKKKI